MRLDDYLLWLLLIAIGSWSPAAWAGPLTDPFRIPPNGQPEQLVGGLDYEGPSALAFDSHHLFRGY